MSLRTATIAGLVALGFACTVKYEDGITTTREVTVSAACGNAIVEIGEYCDDGNTSNEDACTSDCKRRQLLCDTAWIPEGMSCVLPPRCGDGNVDSGEECDDGNTADGDECPAGCLFPPEADCGNGTSETGEACDDGNTRNGDYCASNCHFITGRCGDFVIQQNEVCDDGNNADGEYCSANCGAVTGRCGDGVVQTGEACDDSNRINGDYCSADCRTASGRCGDGIQQVNEGCDDSNASDGDLCPANCSALDLSQCSETWDAALCPAPTDRFLTYSGTPGASDNACAVRLDGKVFCRGGNLHGQCGIGTASSVNETGRVPLATTYPFRQVSAAVGGYVACGVAVDNSLWCWGSNLKRGLGIGDAPAPENCHVTLQQGQNGNGYLDNTPCSTVPNRVGGRVDWKKAISAGELVCALSLGGELWCWGTHSPQYPYTASTFMPRPTRIAAGHVWTDVQISNAGNASNDIIQNIYAIDNAGQLWRWPSYTLGIPARRITEEPEQVQGLTGTVVSVSVYNRFAVAATTTGTYSLVLQALTRPPPVLLSTTPLFQEVSIAKASFDTETFACGRTEQNQLYCWGKNTKGQLADGTQIDRATPVLSHNGELYGGFGEYGPTCLIRPNGVTECLQTNGTHQPVHEH